MLSMSRLIALGAILLSVLGSGAMAGLWNGRWGTSQSVQQAVSRLDRARLWPTGPDWDVQEKSLSAREAGIAELDGHISRQYFHRRKGTMISVLLACGRAGPISVHTPEVCYLGAGYTRVGAAKSYEGTADLPFQFQVCDFRKTNVATPTLLRVFLSWGFKGEWSAPANPRLSFAGRPYLYKLYVVRGMSKANEPIDQDPATELIKDLMPQLLEALFTGS
jgi:hypothetical protein